MIHSADQILTSVSPSSCARLITLLMEQMFSIPVLALVENVAFLHKSVVAKRITSTTLFQRLVEPEMQTALGFQ
jgi:hypothetical protein